MNHKYFVYRLLQKFSDTLWPMGGFLKRIVTNLPFTECNESKHTSFRCTNACFVYRMTQNVFDILWSMFGNEWKCILNYVP